jgi:hypothetical protein
MIGASIAQGDAAELSGRFSDCDLADFIRSFAIAVDEATTVELSAALPSDPLSSWRVHLEQELAAARLARSNALDHHWANERRGSSPLLAPASQALDVFLCHASDDKPFVRDLASRLGEVGYDVWLDETRLLSGHDWDSEIRVNVRSSSSLSSFLGTQSQKRAMYRKSFGSLLMPLLNSRPDPSSSYR